MSLASAMQTMAPATFDSMGGQVGDSLKSGATPSPMEKMGAAIRTDVGRNEGMLAESKKFQMPNDFTLNTLPISAPQGTFGEAAFRQRNGFGV